MLSHLGAIAVPEAIADKLYAAEPLTPAGTEIVDGIPVASERILASLPRLEGVRQILAGYHRRSTRANGTGSSPWARACCGSRSNYDEL